MNKKGVFWGILIILAGFIGVIFGWNYVASAKQSQSWLTTEGTMVSATLSAHAKNGSSDGGYSTDVSYIYQIDGQSYQSDHIAFNGARQYNNEAKAQAAIEGYSAGKPVTVYYNPDDPSVSVLETGVSWQAYRPLGLALLVIILGGYLVRDQLASKKEN